MNREWDEPVSPRGRGEQKITSREAIDRFDRTIEISHEFIIDAETALQASDQDQDEINLCIENLSVSISNLERNLTNTLHIYENDATASTDDIIIWRKDKKRILEKRKETLKQLKQTRIAL